MTIAATIRELVREECGREANVFGPAFFEEHVAVVADAATRLAGELGADAEIVELAAWLHDLAAVRDPATLPEHAARGAALAREILSAHGYPEERASRVAGAIAAHSVPGGNSPEEICVSNADAVAQIARPAYWLYFAFHVRKLDFHAGRQWLEDLFAGRWKAMAPEARNLARELSSPLMRF
jgi:uncharacterized protein